MRTIPAYQTDRAGHYTGDTVADECQVQPGVFYAPAGCTLTPPPNDWPNDKWPRWTGSSWDLVTKPAAANDNTPVGKLAAFLAANPDVQEMISNQGGV